MQQNRSTPTSAKRGPGFAQIRRGLLAHLPGMSSNAAKLYLWFHLKAFWQGPKRGWVEVSFDDMALGNGWGSKTLQRTIEELEANPYIEVERAANQYELTRVKILKYDREESTSAVDKSDQSSTVGVDCAVDSGVDNFDHGAVHSKPASAQSQQDLLVPKKGLEVKKGNNEKHDAVRRPINAELRIAICKSFSPSEKRKKLEKRLMGAVLKNRNTFNDELDDEEREAFSCIKYEPSNPRSLPCGFVFVVWDVYDRWKAEALSPGILCSKIIDRCMSQQESCRTLGVDPSEFFWPPDFQDHRDMLRAQERPREQAARASNGLRA